MERERTAQRPDGAGGPEGPGDGVEAILAQDILAAADRILDGIKPINAELYLRQNEQRGGQ
jgi:hypothetical protein